MVNICRYKCVLFFSASFLSCEPLSTPAFPCMCVRIFVYFQELGAQVTFGRRKQCCRIPGNFLPLFLLNTEVYMGWSFSYSSDFDMFLFFLVFAFFVTIYLLSTSLLIFLVSVCMYWVWGAVLKFYLQRNGSAMSNYW